MDPFYLALPFWLLTQREERRKEGKVKKVGIYNVERSSSPSQSFVVVVVVVVVVFASSVKPPLLGGTPDHVDAVVFCAFSAFVFAASAKTFFLAAAAW